MLKELILQISFSIIFFCLNTKGLSQAWQMDKQCRKVRQMLLDCVGNSETCEDFGSKDIEVDSNDGKRPEREERRSTYDI